jgi:hypothetical protein
MSEAPEDPLRRLARERGRILGELGVRPEDAAWTRSEADAIASLTKADMHLHMPEVLARLLRRLTRAAR